MYRKTFAEKPQYPRLRDRPPDAGNGPCSPQPPKTGRGASAFPKKVSTFGWRLRYSRSAEASRRLLLPSLIRIFVCRTQPCGTRTMNNPKGIAYAALSSSTFGLAPLFTVTLLRDGFSPFEVLTYRWGVASAALLLFGLATGRRLRIARRDFGVVFLLSLFRAGCSLSLVFAYANIATGVASTIHFLYPLAVALAMTLFFRERCSRRLFTAIAVSLAGAALLSSGDIRSNGGDATFGIAAAFFSVISYAGYIIGVRKSRAAQVESTTLTLLVMAIGAALFAAAGSLTSGLHWVDDSRTWGNILGLAIPATAVSNIALVKAIKAIGPTLTSILGAMEPLTAVLIGVLHFGEPFTAAGIAGVVLSVAAVTIIVTQGGKPAGNA